MGTHDTRGDNFDTIMWILGENRELYDILACPGMVSTSLFMFSIRGRIQHPITGKTGLTNMPLIQGYEVCLKISLLSE